MLTLRSGQTNEGREKERELKDVVLGLSAETESEKRETKINTSGMTVSSNNCTFIEIYSISVPMMICIGMIHDLRRPTDGKKNASTIGDQSSFKEYG